MAYTKVQKVETGIWLIASSEEDRDRLQELLRSEDKKQRRKAMRGPYLADVSCLEPGTGKRNRERRTFNRLDLAIEWRKSWLTDAHRREIRREKKQRAMPFDTFASEYLENWSKVEKKENSYKRDCFSVDRLKEYFGRRSITEIARRDVERYVAQRRAKGRKNSTVNRELCCLKNMLRKAVDWEYLTGNPAWGVKQSKEEPKEFDFLTEQEADILLEKCLPFIRTFLALAIHTGLRKSEMFRLEWRDVSFRKGQKGVITVRDTKNHETRHVPMNDMVRASLEAHPKRIVDGKLCVHVLCNEAGKPYKDLRRAFRTSLDNAEIHRHIRINDLRHTFASHLVMKGVDLRTVAMLMGHKDIKMTMRYAHLAPDHLQAAVDKLTDRSKSSQGKKAVSI